MAVVDILKYISYLTNNLMSIENINCENSEGSCKEMNFNCNIEA